MTRTLPSIAIICLAVFFAVPPGRAAAQCQNGHPLQNHTGSSGTPCPCFLAGEQVGVVLDAPAMDYPIEILKVGIRWESQFGGEPDTIEQAIHIYPSGLPDPGTPIFSLAGPTLSDGVTNVFDLEPAPGEIVVVSGPFTVALEFQNTSDGNMFAPSVVYDGDGCQSGLNVVLVESIGWADACPLGVPGDWVMFVEYRLFCDPLPGDADCDADVDAGDIQLFIQSLLDSNCPILNADVDDSGAIDLNDLDDFVTCLLEDACPA